MSIRKRDAAGGQEEWISGQAFRRNIERTNCWRLRWQTFAGETKILLQAIQSIKIVDLLLTNGSQRCKRHIMRVGRERVEGGVWR